MKLNSKVKTETPSIVNFVLTPRFFGLNKKHSFHLQSMIFDMIWYSDSRFDWDTIYYMPIHIRKFYYNKIKEKLNIKAESAKNAKNKRQRKK